MPRAVGPIQFPFACPKQTSGKACPVEPFSVGLHCVARQSPKERGGGDETCDSADCHRMPEMRTFSFIWNIGGGLGLCKWKQSSSNTQYGSWMLLLISQEKALRFLKQFCCGIPFFQTLPGAVSLFDNRHYCSNSPLFSSNVPHKPHVAEWWEKKSLC